MTERKVSRWYFGGLASCGAACCTHPLDLLKVGAWQCAPGSAAELRSQWREH
ncbi:DIC protein, partial [Amia calva]|nr:DIC protein [Amia calva]